MLSCMVAATAARRAPSPPCRQASRLNSARALAPAATAHLYCGVCGLDVAVREGDGGRVRLGTWRGNGLDEHKIGFNHVQPGGLHGGAGRSHVCQRPPGSIVARRRAAAAGAVPPRNCCHHCHHCTARLPQRLLAAAAARTLISEGSALAASRNWRTALGRSATGYSHQPSHSAQVAPQGMKGRPFPEQPGKRWRCACMQGCCCFLGGGSGSPCTHPGAAGWPERWAACWTARRRWCGAGCA